MKILIAVMSCHPYRDRAEAVRSTWAKDMPEGENVDVRFFLGKADREPLPGEVFLDAPDDYRNFPAKVRAMRRWALEAGYEHVCKMDDDVYARPERLLASGFEKSDYLGRVRGPSMGYPAPYCSGFAYWLSRNAIAKIVDAPWNGDTAEDRFTGNVLLQAGIRPDHDSRYAVVWSKNNARSHCEPPRQGNSIIAACEYPPHLMRAVHQDFPTSRALFKPPSIASGAMNRVAVVIKTFLRDGYLHRAIKGIRQTLPDIKMVIVDDGAESFEKITGYADLRLQGHACIWLPFDSGFGAKANAAFAHCDREYVLIGADDFDFSDLNVRAGIERMLKVLDRVPALGVVSGRVDGRPYESVFEHAEFAVRERPGFRESGEVEGVRYHLCDLTVNYSLVRREVLNHIRWDEEVKIGGGEHGAFFLDVQKAGWQVAYVEGVNINQMKPGISAWQDKRYPALRARARNPGLPCLTKRGIKSWQCQDGRIEFA